MTVAGVPVVGVGTPDHAAHLLGDLYVTLRRNLQRWASVTQQTPQPRMGYVGQHLVSVVTGFPGGRTGARGDDLVLPNEEVAEIKCCYRVDQLGECGRCGAGVASIEAICPNPKCMAPASEIIRKDDSKWLLSPKDEDELRELFDPVVYYLVLFEFVDVDKADDINVQIFSVNPRNLGFSLAMIDYYFSIRSKSASSAPFNWWPWSPKFYMMKPMMIYWSIIHGSDDIDTRMFPGRDQPVLSTFGALDNYTRVHTFKQESALDALAVKMRVSFSGMSWSKKDTERRKQKLLLLQSHREKHKWSDERLADDLARSFYGDKIKSLSKWTKEFAPTL